MKIAAPLPPVERQTGTPGEAVARATISFGDLLAQLGVSAASQPERGAMRSNPAPEIGDSAIGFGERPVVLLTAPPGSHERASGRKRAIEGIAHQAADAARALARPGQHPGAADAHAATASPVTTRPSPSMTGLPPGATEASLPAHHGSSTKPAAEAISAGRFATQTDGTVQNRQAASQPGPAASATARAANALAVRSAPIQAALVAMDDGFRLIVRVPGLSDEEQADLSERLAELFAQMGEAPPELVIHRSAMSSEGD